MLKVFDYDSYIFDVDGTLYSQPKLRIGMLMHILEYYLLRPLRLDEVFIIYKFRRYREKGAYKSATIGELCGILADKIDKDAEFVKSVIIKWMLEEPLRLIQKYKFNDIKNFIDIQSKRGKKIIIYSDYPAKEKLECMRISYNEIFYFGDGQIAELKPSKKSMIKIMNRTVGNCLYIGDRYTKDGVSAELVNIDYFDVGEFRNLLKKEFNCAL